ncbi:MAG TPA: CapA family protein [Streptosporangiaceae bacterium]|nr:CapA family protein [Streptosporangiaceae bacterium]
MSASNQDPGDAEPPRPRRDAPGPRHGAAQQSAGGWLRRDQVLISVGIVLLAAVLGVWALVATRPRPPARPSGTASNHVVPAVRQSSATARPAPATVSITWVGDMTFGTLNAWPPAGTGSLLAGVKSDLRSDLTMGNLETVLGSLPMSKCKPREKDCYQFEAPTDTATDLKRDGFAAVSVANNHTLDAGDAGEVSTDAALRTARLKWTGRPGQITYLTRNGVKIALLGFAPWPYDADALAISPAEALVREARHHAQVVIVLEHLGGEGDSYRHVRPGEEYFLGQDRGDSVAFTHGVIDAGADLVMGSGPHVLRGFQWYRGHLIAYSLGNFCGYYTVGLDSYTSISAVLHVTLTDRGQFVRGSVTPLQLAGAGIPHVDPNGTAIAYINALSHDDFARNGAVHISAAGALDEP